MIKWGILGYGRMGSEFTNAILETSNSKLVAIASKSKKIEVNNEKYINLSIHKDYEEVIKNKNIDAVYIATLNNSHVNFIKDLSNERKSILCEKPLSTNLLEATEVEKIIKKNNINFFEAIAYYAHPQTKEIQKIINNNEIGEIIKIESSFGFKVNKIDPNSRLFNKELGGGAILDVGCYPLSFLMLFCNNINNFNFKDKKLNFSKTGVDDHAEAKIILNDSIEAEIKVSLKENLENKSIIYGTKGKIIVNNPWLPQKKSVIEVRSDHHYYKQFIKSELSIYAKQIQNVADVIIEKNEEKNNLFDINKSIICMSLIEKWKSV